MIDQFVCKVVLIGDQGVGKTSIFNRRLYDKFTLQTTSTVQPQTSPLKVMVQGVEVNVKLWDTAGQEAYRSITISYYKQSRGAFIVFDMTSKQSFDNVKLWARQLKNHVGDDLVKVILGNKADQTNLEVEEADVKQLAESINAIYFIVSAFQNKNIVESFDAMAQELHKRFYKGEPNRGQGQDKGGQKLSTQSFQQTDKTGCC
ncbi:hypothetical protein pb186bvf_002063 [Paramecium bursaria]